MRDMKETRMCIAKWKQPIWKFYIVDDFSYMTFWKRQNHGNSEKISECQVLGWEKLMNSQSKEKF
jgi:hypothetical protein